MYANDNGLFPTSDMDAPNGLWIARVLPYLGLQWAAELLNEGNPVFSNTVF